MVPIRRTSQEQQGVARGTGERDSNERDEKGGLRFPRAEDKRLERVECEGRQYGSGRGAKKDRGKKDDRGGTELKGRSEMVVRRPTTAETKEQRPESGDEEQWTKGTVDREAQRRSRGRGPEGCQTRRSAEGNERTTHVEEGQKQRRKAAHAHLGGEKDRTQKGVDCEPHLRGRIFPRNDTERQTS
ncbi:hypothetical protein TRVL_10085 [Trypanosoma vivax]|nr:hypothetical protein TRVL_10085 [Trypanosoma vivax]